VGVRQGQGGRDAPEKKTGKHGSVLAARAVAACSPEKMMRAEEVLTGRVQAREGVFKDGDVEAKLRKGGIEEWIACRRGTAVAELGNPNGDDGVGKLGARVRR